jgi:Zn-dependent membrane protease YugP
MSGWGLYFAFLIPPMIIGFAVQAWLKKTVARNMQVEVANGLSGADVARQILDRNGLQGVPVEPSPGGPLSDHYDPRTKSVHLSEPVYSGRSVASSAIAAHEVGHAIQHEKAYAPFRLRSAMWPAVAFASQAWLFILMIGLFAQIAGLMTVAVILFAVVVLFQLVTLPVEFDASRRAMAQINDLGLVSSGESQGARKVLTAAAMTYVAAALAALTQLAYWLLVLRR